MKGRPLFETVGGGPPPADVPSSGGRPTSTEELIAFLDEKGYGLIDLEWMLTQALEES